MRTSIALGALVLALVAAGALHAGGFATVGVAPLPEGIEPGGTWSPEITILQHGRTPIGGLSPTVTIREADAGLERSFVAKETAETGTYEAAVVFPEAGQWSVRVETGWWGEGDLTLGPVAIVNAPAGSPGTGDAPVVPLTVGALVLLLLAGGAALGVRRRWRPTPASR
jgi:hypothetical protein